jgi:gliding motility-associated-like protein
MKTLCLIICLILTNSLLSQDLFVPNAFTPDGDGTNDVFKVHTTDSLAFYELTIWNNYGEKIFQTNDINQPWTGGGDYYSPLTSYSYLVEWGWEKYDRFKKSGFIFIIR